MFNSYIVFMLYWDNRWRNLSLVVLIVKKNLKVVVGILLLFDIVIDVICIVRI